MRRCDGRDTKIHQHSIAILPYLGFWLIDCSATSVEFVIGVEKVGLFHISNIIGTNKGSKYYQQATYLVPMLPVAVFIADFVSVWKHSM